MHSENDKSVISNSSNKELIVKPKLNNFLIAFIIFSIPGFITSLIWMLVAILILIGAAGAVSTLGDGLSVEGPELQYASVDSNKTSENKILVYNFNGAISMGNRNSAEQSRETETLVELVRKDFKKIKADDSIKNVVFKFNSPGGEVTASKILGDEINLLLEDLGQTQGVFYFDRIAASGVLYASYKVNNNYIYGSEYGETGSVGVVFTLSNLTEASEKVGYKEYIIKSSPEKDLGNLFREPTNSELDYLQNEVNKEYTKFKNIVASGRKIESEDVDKLATGLTFENQVAKELKLIDEVGEITDATQKAAENAGLGDDYEVLEIVTPVGRIDSFIAQNNSLKNIFGLVENTQLGKRASLEPGRAYFIDINKI